MRIRKAGCVPSSPSSFHRHRLLITPPPPPDLVSSTTSHIPRSPSADLPTSTKTLGKKPTRISLNTFMYSLCQHQNELPLLAHSLPPVMTSKINASICSNQPGMLVGEKEKATYSKKSTGSNNLSGCSSGTTGADTSDATSPSLFLSRRWCEEEKMFPMKKRRQSLERFINRGSELQIKNEKSTTTWPDMGSNNIADNYYMIGRKKDVKVEEMSCTKSNGLGWRCWRRRLEGFTRCSHHVKCGRMGYLKRKKMIESNGGDGGGDQDFRMGIKKRKRVMMMSRILDRTVPLVDANNYPDFTI